MIPLSKPNYGKDFENIIKKSFNEVPDTFVQRLYDTTNGFSGIRQPSDFIVYHYPYQYFVECKCTWENTFRHSKLTQLDDLLERAEIKGIHGIVIIWFISHDVTVAIPAETIKKHFENHTSVSATKLEELNATGMMWMKLPGKKRRVFYDYDMQDFFNYFSCSRGVDGVIS